MWIRLHCVETNTIVQLAERLNIARSLVLQQKKQVTSTVRLWVAQLVNRYGVAEIDIDRCAVAFTVGRYLPWQRSNIAQRSCNTGTLSANRIETEAVEAIDSRKCLVYPQARTSFTSCHVYGSGYKCVKCLFVARQHADSAILFYHFCPSVRPSRCGIVSKHCTCRQTFSTFWYDHHSSFLFTTAFTKFQGEPRPGVLNTRQWEIIAISTEIAVYLWNGKGPWLLWITNRKS